MKNVWKSLTVVVGVVALSLTASMAQDSGALVDALVKKGVLTDQEAEEIRADLTKEYAETSAGKLEVSSFVQSLKFYGDIRYRYEDDMRSIYGTNGPTTGGQVNQTRNRNRLRVRLGAEFAFTDNFKAGVRVATGPGGNSTNDDLGTVNSNGQGTGAFGSDQNANLHIDLAYLEADKAFGQDWLTLVVGKQLLGQKFVQGWTWDTDINPEGGLEKFGDFKIGDDFYVNATSGQYIYGGITTDNVFGTNTNVNNATGGDDQWMFVNQVTFGYKPAKGYKLEVTPGFVNFAGSTKTTNAATLPYIAGNATGANYNGANPAPVGLNVFTTNISFEHPLPYGLTGKLYADYGINLSSQYRASQLSVTAYPTLSAAGAPGVGAYGGRSGDGDRNQFAVVGYQIGKGKGKGSWTLDSTMVYQEAYSWDPNLTDSDWNAGQLNGFGFGIKPTYYITDFLTATLNYRHSQAIQSFQGAGDVVPGFLATGGSQVKSTDLLQVDLQWKF